MTVVGVGCRRWTHASGCGSSTSMTAAVNVLTAWPACLRVNVSGGGKERRQGYQHRRRGGAETARPAEGQVFLGRTRTSSILHVRCRSIHGDTERVVMSDNGNKSDFGRGFNITCGVIAALIVTPILMFLLLSRLRGGHLK